SPAELDVHDFDSFVEQLTRQALRAHGAWYDGRIIRLFSTTFASSRLFYRVAEDGSLLVATEARRLARARPRLIAANADGRVLPPRRETVFSGVSGVEPFEDVVFRTEGPRVH